MLQVIIILFLDIWWYRGQVWIRVVWTFDTCQTDSKRTSCQIHHQCHPQTSTI